VAALGSFVANSKRSGDRFQDCLRVFRSDAQEHAGGAGGLAASLLPISQCRRADANADENAFWLRRSFVRMAVTESG